MDVCIISQNYMGNVWAADHVWNKFGSSWMIAWPGHKCSFVIRVSHMALFSLLTSFFLFVLCRGVTHVKVHPPIDHVLFKGYKTMLIGVNWSNLTNAGWTTTFVTIIYFSMCIYSHEFSFTSLCANANYFPLSKNVSTKLGDDCYWPWKLTTRIRRVQ